jgi:hypothetical protein
MFKSVCCCKAWLGATCFAKAGDAGGGGTEGWAVRPLPVLGTESLTKNLTVFELFFSLERPFFNHGDCRCAMTPLRAHTGTGGRSGPRRHSAWRQAAPYPSISRNSELFNSSN